MDDFDLESFLGDFDESKPADSPQEPEISDAEVDETFKALVQGFEEERQVIEAAAAVIEAEGHIALVEREHEAAKIELEQVDKEEEELLRKVREVQQRKAALRAKVFDTRVGKNRVVREKESAERKLDQVKETVLFARQEEKTREELSKKAEDFTWFKGTDPDNYKILPHQMQGAEFLVQAGRALLGDGMGLGKSLTSIAALDLAGSKRAIVIAPADVTDNFIKEFQMWAPHRPVINIKGMTKEERNFVLNTADTVMESFVIVTNYESWRKDFSLLTRFGNLGIDTVIADEAHTIKNKTTDAFKGVEDFVLTKNLCPVCPDRPVMKIDDENIKFKGASKLRKCASCGWSGESFELNDKDGHPVKFKEKYMHTRSVKNFWAMTGTPILNDPADLYPVLYLMDPTSFREKSHYLRDYCQQDPYTGRWQFTSGGLDYLTKHVLKGKFLARTMEDAGIIIPPQRPITHTLTLTAEQYPEQTRIVKELNEHSQFILEQSGNSVSAMAVIALITRQRQANVWPGGIVLKDDEGNVIFRVKDEITESIKIDKAVELIVDLVGQGKRVALFSQFKSALEEIHNRINGNNFDGVEISSVRFDGDTKQDVKEQVKTNFDKKRREEKKWDVVLAHYKSGGVGLNFTACEHTIILDREWNPGKEDQALARTRRIGQDVETFVHQIEVENSIDKWFEDIISSKKDMIDGFNTSTQDIQAAYLAALRKGNKS